MSKEHNHRVLNRLGAHELTAEEIRSIKGGALPSLLSVIRTNAPGGGTDYHLDE